MGKKKSSISLDTILKLPDEVVTYNIDEELIVISPNDGNWLVLSEAQLQAFEQLRSGRTVGEVISMASDRRMCLSLLKQIVARDFTEKELSVASRNTKVFFYLTYKCNLQCEHCYMYAQHRKAPILSVHEYEEIFDGLKRNGVEEMIFSGGEPLMRSDFWEIINIAHKKGLISKVFSNGTLWTDADIEKASDFAIKVQISIDGVDEESCAIVRGANVFERAKNTAVELAKAGVDVEISTTPIWANMEAVEHGYSDFVNELHEKAGREIKCRVSLDLLSGRNMPNPSEAEKKEYENRCLRLYSTAKLKAPQTPFFEAYKKGQGRIACGIGRLVFSPDGFVHVCSRLAAFPSIGNVRDIGVQQLLEDARMRMLATSVDNTIPCRECALRYVCGGGCRADRYEFVSTSMEKPSMRKPCPKEYKTSLLRMMMRATKVCYTWD